MKLVTVRTRFPVWFTFSIIARLCRKQCHEFFVIADPSNPQGAFEKECGQYLREADSILHPYDPRKGNRRCVLGSVCRPLSISTLCRPTVLLDASCASPAQ